ncbi:S1 RNA-binding domain-containing protein [Streptococcus pneumoniae]|nr:S1 RNA-binding domain-containing protein [Streptococcus pneumoniae]
MCFTHSFFHFATLENLSNHVSVTLSYVWLLTSSVLSTTSKQCFEQPAASFLVCSLIFIEY